MYRYNVISLLLNVLSFVCFVNIVNGNCRVNNGECQHRCTDIMGGATQCQCEPGYRLRYDQKTCEDIDECEQDNGGCEDVCTNLPGTALCSCTKGSLSMDAHSCTVSKLRCHECDTYQKPSDCGDPMVGDDNVGGCGYATHCLKLKTVVTKANYYREHNPSDANKLTVISRQCANAPHVSNGCTYHTGSGSKYIRCYCDTDECNGSVKMATSFVVMVATLVLRFV